MNLLPQILLITLGIAFILFGIFIVFLPEVKEKGIHKHEHQ